MAALVLSILLVAWLAFSIPPTERLWAKMHGAAKGAIIAREDGSGLAVVKGDAQDFKKDTVWLFGNGIGQSWLPYGSGHTQIGLLAVALHPKPAEVAVIGLGSGDTVYALGGSPHTQRITCIEIVEGNHAALKELAPRMRYPALDALLQDARIQWEFTDGRAYVSRSGKQFDVIEADALRPTSAYSGNLYSWEYFRTVKAHLKPDGLAISWAPTDRVLASFLQVFPYVIVVNGIAVGSQQPIDTDASRISQRLADPFTTQYYARIENDLQPHIQELVAGQFSRYAPETNRPENAELNSDLFPRDEYLAPRP